MSPEQARGKAVDRRTDMWAFGCVLYEMLTGKRTFGSDDMTDTIAAVVRAEPDWSALPAGTPAAIRKLLRRALTKDRRERLSDAAVARLEIDEALAEPAAEDGVPAAGVESLDARRVPGWRAVAAISVAGLALIAVTGAAVWNLRPAALSPAQPVSRFTISLPPGEQLDGLRRASLVAVSVDGRRLAYTARTGAAASRVYVREIDSLESRPLAGTERAVDVFFSPDGAWLGFDQAALLKKVSVTGGSPVSLAASPNRSGASWGPGSILFSPTANSAIQQVSDSGGNPQPVTHLDKGETSHHWPELLPQGQGVLFASDTGQIAVHDLRTGERRNLIAGASPRYAASGHLVFAQDGTLMAAPFDVERLALTGAAVPVMENVLQSAAQRGPSGRAQYSISATGTLVYVPGGAQSLERKLVWVTRAGVEQLLAGAPARNYTIPRLASDGQRIAVDEDTNRNVWLYRPHSRDIESIGIWRSPSGLGARWQARGVRLGTGGAAEHLLAARRRQWRRRAVDQW